eukprot:sb/3474123/
MGAAAKLSFFIITIVLLGFVLFDIKQNGSFKASQTGQAVNGVIEHKNVKTALASAQVYCEIAHGYGMHPIYTNIGSCFTAGEFQLCSGSPRGNRTTGCFCFYLGNEVTPCQRACEVSSIPIRDDKSEPLNENSFLYSCTSKK